MSELISTINEADYLVNRYRLGFIAAEVLQEELTSRRFFDIEIDVKHVSAKLDNIKWELGHDI